MTNEAARSTALNPFAPASPEAWRALAEKALKGADLATLRTVTRDGIAIEPLSARAAGASVLADRSGAWKIMQRIEYPDPAEANRQALADLAGGADGLVLVLDGAPSAAGFGLPATAEALKDALDGVEIEAIRLRLEPGATGAASGKLLAALIGERELAPESLDIAFGIDPVGHAARFGGRPDLSGIGEAIKELSGAGFAGPFLAADGRAYHAAGASEAQELGAVLATIAAYLRALDAEGIAPESGLAGISVTLAAGHDQFPTIAKLRAMRLLFRRLAELCGASGTKLRLHAETARRMMMAADAHTNLIRTTIAAFAAAAGGAESIAVLPYSAANGLAEAHARRLARNIQHLLMAESGVHHLDDPAAGSGAVEALTDALAEKGWAGFQAIEKEGGIAESLASGALAERISAMRGKMLARVTSGEMPFVGATLYPNPSEAAIAVAAPARSEEEGGLAPLGPADIAAQKKPAETKASEGANR
ncbi:methylmalonyl-CoA mutase family protein [Afifella sp. IM 167]|uniref:methylmalonyl-CoA mutase family protein n=1 Tax=Afifella sp. IM 167 TaxID=2033586 RepID=UPI001CCA7ECB|nr:methylmalonyl-CoA mutase family protein [Afifella sp. IM 167]MBZ8133141.1 methylmalonyl-CoA mutase [Afifella sp. IM 167]